MSQSLSGRLLVCLSSVDWEDCWQAPQQICFDLADQGATVLFIENTTVRRPEMGDVGRVWRRLASYLSGRGRFRQQRPRLYLYSPPVVPFPYSSWARWLNRVWAIRSVVRWSRRMQTAPPLFLTFLPTPFGLDLKGALSPEASVYCCAAHFVHSSPGARQIQAFEKQMVQGCDWVVTFAHELERHCRQLGGRVHRMPLGVDLQVFDPGRAGGPVPPELRDLPRPIIGYIGGLHGVLDQELLLKLCDLRPDWSFVLVGPEVVPSPALHTRPNLHPLGFRPHSELPRYLSHFAVGLIPYKVNQYSSGVYPSKLMEYLALGKPVVSTPLAEIACFNQEFGRPVEVAVSPAEFVERIQAALQPDPEAEQARRQLALTNSWGRGLEQLVDLLSRS